MCVEREKIDKTAVGDFVKNKARQVIDEGVKLHDELKIGAPPAVLIDCTAITGAINMEVLACSLHSEFAC